MAPPKSSKGKGKGKGKASNKPYPDLGPSSLSQSSTISSGQKPESHLLLLLGDIRGDGGMIGDFMGLIFCFKNHCGVSGNFWSCFDIAGKLVDPEFKHKDIKFGRAGEETVVYDQFSAQHRSAPYDYVHPDAIWGKFEQWIYDRTKQSQTGDTINIILITHGTVKGELQFGNSRIDSSSMSELISKFKDVEVNVITNACYGGILVGAVRDAGSKNRYIQSATREDEKSYAYRSSSNRFRNFYFTGALVKSLGAINWNRLGQPSAQSSGGSIAMAEMFTRFADATFTTAPELESSHPENYLSSNWTAAEKVKDILHLEYVDFPRNPKGNSRFLRNESAMSDLKDLYRSLPDTGTGSLSESLVDVVLKDCGNPCTDDHTLDENLSYSPKASQHKQGIVEVYWRLRKQSLVWECFLCLVHHRVIDLSGLKDFLSLHNFNPQDSEKVRRLCLALTAFEQFNEMLNPTRQQLDAGVSRWYMQPLQWFATVILRGALVNNPDFIHEYLNRHGHLGASNSTIWRKYIPENTLIGQMDEAGKPEILDKIPINLRKKQGSIGFILPMGLGDVAYDLEEVYRIYTVRHEEIKQLLDKISPLDLVI